MYGYNVFLKHIFFEACMAIMLVYLGLLGLHIESIRTPLHNRVLDFDLTIGCLQVRINI
jgi:hypothetical protein